ncbi:hypothetical protein AU476_07450 [Cupriavidus sp. UYMSc13B]|nr:hypothetical protein AU476_07450 [Cupriavidus sp. UYMSc13B]
MTTPNEDASQSDAAIDLTGALTTIVREEITAVEHLARPIIEGLERGCAGFWVGRRCISRRGPAGAG